MRYEVVLVMCIVLSSVAFAETQSHPAEEINAGTIAGALTITTTGRVGIGTTTPSEKLQVNGNVAAAIMKASSLCLGTDCRSAWAGPGGVLPTCANGQVVKYNTATGKWDTCSNDGIGGVQNCPAGKIIKSTSPGVWACSDDTIGGITSCPAGKILKVNAQGQWACADDSTGTGTIPTCADGKIVKSSSGQWVCADDAIGTGTIPTCQNGQIIKTSNGQWACSSDLLGLDGAMPDCPAGKIAKVNAQGQWSCSDDVIGSITSCPEGKIIKYSNGQWACSDDAIGGITSCPAGQIIKVDANGAWQCSSDLLGLDGSMPDCPAGKIAKVIASGSWDCADDIVGGISSCANGKIIKASNGQWVCSDDAIGSITSCPDGKIIKRVNGQWECSDDTIGTMQPCGQNQIPKFVGGAWTCSNDNTGIEPWVVSGTNVYRQSGKVGVGTTAPWANLQVDFGQGSVNTIAVAGSTISDDYQGIMRLRSGGDKVVFDDADDKVGIGTASPTEKLDVAGNVKASGSVKGSQLCIGADCRNAWPTGGGGSGGSDGQCELIMSMTSYPDLADPSISVNIPAECKDNKACALIMTVSGLDRFSQPVRAADINVYAQGASGEWASVMESQDQTLLSVEGPIYRSTLSKTSDHNTWRFRPGLLSQVESWDTYQYMVYSCPMGGGSSLPTGCTDTQVAKFVGGQWICANDNGGSGTSLPACAEGQLIRKTATGWGCSEAVEVRQGSNPPTPIATGRMWLIT